MREPGFYWVRLLNGNEWEVAEWLHGWFRPGSLDMCEDADFAEIGPKIAPPVVAKVEG